MIMNKGQKTYGNCFSEFEDITTKKRDIPIQVLYDYEKHYMELLKKYSTEITMIHNMLKEFRDEQKTFYGTVLPKIIQKLKEDDGIDSKIKSVWVEQLTANMERSFSLSESLINDFAIKNINQFKNAVNEKLGKEYYENISTG